MAQSEVRRWIAASPARVFAALRSHALSFAWLGTRYKLLAPPAASADVGTTVICPLRQGACQLCITAVRPEQFLALEVANAGQTVRARFIITPQCGGSLLICITRHDAIDLLPMRVAVGRIYQAFGRVPGTIKQIVEGRV